MPFVAGSGESLTGIQTLLNNAWSVLTAVFGQIAGIVDVIVDNPLLMIPTGIALAYACVKIFRRFIVSV